MDTTDLQVFLAIQRAGSLRGAAHTLGVSRSTVMRRLEALQRHAGTTLMERTPEGARLTPTGEALVPIAERAEAEVLAAERLFAGRDVGLSGRLDLTVFNLGAPLLAPLFADFVAAHPDVELHVSSSNSLVSLQRRDADIAVRGIARPDPNLFGRRIGQLAYGIFGTQALVTQTNPPWVLWKEHLGAHTTWAVARAHASPLEVAIQVDDFMAMVACVQAGLGVALLPVAIARRAPGLVPLGGVVEGAGLDVWVLTHPDLRRSARVRAMMTMLGERGPERLV